MSAIEFRPNGVKNPPMRRLEYSFRLPDRLLFDDAPWVRLMTERAASLERVIRKFGGPEALGGPCTEIVVRQIPSSIDDPYAFGTRTDVMVGDTAVATVSLECHGTMVEVRTQSALETFRVIQ